MRKAIGLNNGWLFQKPGSAPVAVSLPHTWNASDGQDGGNDYFRGRCTYTRALTVPKPEDGSRVYLEFQGAAMTAEAFINGRSVVRHEGGYSTFRTDITDYMTGNDTLTVQVDNAPNEAVYPQKADFTFYGGLYRPVSLLMVPPVHFALDGNTTGLKITPCVTGNAARVHAEAFVTGETTVTFTLDGMVQTVLATDGCAEATFLIENVHLWDGVNDPYLYMLTARADSGDEISARFGCRSFSIDPEKGFLLNGRPYPLRGVSRHQDRQGVGNALTSEMHREDMALLRELGANAVRLAHYQHAQEFYDLCDENGIVVWAEIPYITCHMAGGRQNTLDQMTELITQNYNHPSIVCWGLSNEITVGGMGDEVLENHRALHELCRKLDPTRPTVMANISTLPPDASIMAISELTAYNLYFGWYGGELSDNGRFLDDFHARFPQRCLALSEYGADANPQYHTDAPKAGDYSEEYQALYNRSLLQTISERPYLWASFVWNLFDFAADSRSEGGKPGINQKGLVTFDRKIKKDAFYLYKAYWSDEPFIHLGGKRYTDRTGNSTVIEAYTNLPEARLYRDGTLLGVYHGQRYIRAEMPLTGKHVITAEAGECTDEMMIQKVAEANPAYHMETPKKVENWFEKTDSYSVESRPTELFQSAEATALLCNFMERETGRRPNDAALKMMATLPLPLRDILRRSSRPVSEQSLHELNEQLQKIPVCGDK